MGIIFIKVIRGSLWVYYQTGIQKGFSDIRKRVTNYIIDHKEEVANMRLVELAEATLPQQRRSVVLQETGEKL